MDARLLSLAVPLSLPEAKNKALSCSLLEDGAVLTSFAQSGCMHYYNSRTGDKLTVLNSMPALLVAHSSPYVVSVHEANTEDNRFGARDLVLYNTLTRKRERYLFTESAPTGLFCDGLNLVLLGANGEFFRKKYVDFASKPPLVRVASGGGFLANIDTRLSRLKGNRLLLVSGGSFQLWDLLTGNEILSRDESVAVTAVDLSDDALAVATSSLYIWTLGKDNAVSVVEVRQQSVTALALGSGFVVAGTAQGGLVSVSSASGVVLSSLKLLELAATHSPRNDLDSLAEDSSPPTPKKSASQRPSERAMSSRSHTHSSKSNPSSPPLAHAASTGSPPHSPSLSSSDSVVNMKKSKAKSMQALSSRAAGPGLLVSRGEVTCVALVKNHVVVGDAQGHAFLVAIKSSDGHLATLLADQGATTHPLIAVTSVEASVFALTRPRSPAVSCLDGDLVQWSPKFELESKPALKIFHILLPNGLSSSVPYDGAVTLKKILKGVLNKKPELDETTLGEPSDLTGRVLSKSKTLEELGVLEIAWGTSKMEWNLASNHLAVNQFLAEEGAQDPEKRTLKIFLPAGQKSAQLFSSQKSVSDVLEKLFQTRPDLQKLRLQPLTIRGKPIGVDEKLTALEGQCLCLGVDILSWKQNVDMNEKAQEVAISPQKILKVSHRQNSSANLKGSHHESQLSTAVSATEESLLESARKRALQRKVSSVVKGDVAEEDETSTNTTDMKRSHSRTRTRSPSVDKYRLVRLRGQRPDDDDDSAEDGHAVATVEEVAWVDVDFPSLSGESRLEPHAPTTSKAEAEGDKVPLRWNREKGVSLLPLKLPFEIYSNNTLYASRFFKKLSFIWASHGIESMSTGPIVVARRDSDNCAIIFSKLGLNFVRPDLAVTFKNPKRYLKWVCAEVFGLEVKEFNFTAVPTKAKDPFESGLLQLEKNFVPTKHKVGVLNVLPGQGTEKDIYLNDSISADYQEFLNVLGARISLNGFTGYNGGLDTTSKLTTGTHSVYRDLRSSVSPGVMFHVSALIASKGPADPTRKRHIGNDVVVVVFNESGAPFDPAQVLKSHFTHVYIVVTKVRDSATPPETKYEVEVVLRDGVALVPPYLPAPSRQPFRKSHEFEEWLAAKVVNLETSAICLAPDFVKMRSRARDSALGDLIARLVAPKPASPRLHASDSDALSTAPSDNSAEGRKVSFRQGEEGSEGELEGQGAEGHRPRSSSQNAKKSNEMIVVRKTPSSPSLAPLLLPNSADPSLPEVVVTPHSPSTSWKTAKKPHASSEKVHLLSLRSMRVASAPDAQLLAEADDDDAFLDQVAPRQSLVDESISAPFSALLKSLHKPPAHLRAASALSDAGHEEDSSSEKQ